MEEKGVQVFKDGDSWCVLYGEDLQSGIAGFGDTIVEAAEEFAKNMKASNMIDDTLEERHEIVRRRRLREEIEVLEKRLNKYEIDYDIVDGMIRDLRDDQIGVVREITDIRRSIKDKIYEIRYTERLMESAMKTGLAAGKSDAEDGMYFPYDETDEFSRECNHWYEIGWAREVENS